MANSINPLAKHFRQPEIYLSLPSKGNFYPEGSLEISATGELPIYPMTVTDELTLRTPDSLMNGDGMIRLISSCIPSIIDPWAIPLVDLDSILIAIRLASYGKSMDIISHCTACKADNEHAIDLQVMLNSVPPVTGYGETLKISNLGFVLKPQTFVDINRIQKINFEQKKILSLLDNQEISAEDRKSIFDESFKLLSSLNIDTMVSCISSITTNENETVTDPALISEFLNNTSRETYNTLKKEISDIVSNNAIKPISIECDSCHANYETSVEFNQTNFFV